MATSIDLPTAIGHLRTIRQVAEDIGVSTQYVHYLIKEHRLQAIRTPLGFLIDPSDAERLRQEREAKNAA